MRSAKPSVLFGVTLAAVVGVAATAGAQNEPINFTDHIRPIMERSCWNCHGEAAQLSDLDLSSREGALEGGTKGPAIVPGRAEDSRLFRMVAGLDQPAMPMSGDLLTDAELGAVRTWIEEGAHWDTGEVTAAADALAALENDALPPGAPGLLGVPAPRAGAGAGLTGVRPPGRPLPRGVPAERGPDRRAAGRQPDAAAARLSRPDRSAADARAGAGVPGRHRARRLGAVDRQAAGFAPLRRALGPALDGRRALRRHRRVRAGLRPPERLAATATTSSTRSTTTSRTTSSCASSLQATSSITSRTRRASQPASCGPARASTSARRTTRSAVTTTWTTCWRRSAAASSA